MYKALLKNTYLYIYTHTYTSRTGRHIPRIQYCVQLLRRCACVDNTHRPAGNVEREGVERVGWGGGGCGPQDSVTRPSCPPTEVSIPLEAEAVLLSS
jgi:hypothetical protein